MQSIPNDGSGPYQGPTSQQQPQQYNQQMQYPQVQMVPVMQPCFQAPDGQMYIAPTVNGQPLQPFYPPMAMPPMILVPNPNYIPPVQNQMTMPLMQVPVNGSQVQNNVQPMMNNQQIPVAPQVPSIPQVHPSWNNAPEPPQPQSNGAPNQYIVGYEGRGGMGRAIMSRNPLPHPDTDKGNRNQHFERPDRRQPRIPYDRRQRIPYRNNRPCSVHHYRNTHPKWNNYESRPPSLMNPQDIRTPAYFGDGTMKEDYTHVPKDVFVGPAILLPPDIPSLDQQIKLRRIEAEIAANQEQNTAAYNNYSEFSPADSAYGGDMATPHTTRSFTMETKCGTVECYHVKGDQYDVHLPDGQTFTVFENPEVNIEKTIDAMIESDNQLKKVVMDRQAATENTQIKLQQQVDNLEIKINELSTKVANIDLLKTSTVEEVAKVEKPLLTIEKMIQDEVVSVIQSTPVVEQSVATVTEESQTVSKPEKDETSAISGPSQTPSPSRTPESTGAVGRISKKVQTPKQKSSDEKAAKEAAIRLAKQRKIERDRHVQMLKERKKEEERIRKEQQKAENAKRLAEKQAEEAQLKEAQLKEERRIKREQDKERARQKILRKRESRAARKAKAKEKEEEDKKTDQMLKRLLFEKTCENPELYYPDYVADVKSGVIEPVGGRPEDQQGSSNQFNPESEDDENLVLIEVDSWVDGDPEEDEPTENQTEDENVEENFELEERQPENTKSKKDGEED